mmetsp:Transcript_64316/g.74772  ORF Transcript_64316/g.74772 Transcript_64316/m.74772 type:complete len:90 (+) Transcript_64316:224-493(+)
MIMWFEEDEVWVATPMEEEWSGTISDDSDLEQVPPGCLTLTPLIALGSPSTMPRLCGEPAATNTEQFDPINGNSLFYSLKYKINLTRAK